LHAIVTINIVCGVMKEAFSPQPKSGI